MKVEVEKQKAFTPVKITLTIETEQELCNLYLRLNASPNAINDVYNNLKYKACHLTNDHFYNAISDLLNNEYQYLKTK